MGFQELRLAGGSQVGGELSRAKVEWSVHAQITSAITRPASRPLLTVAASGRSGRYEAVSCRLSYFKGEWQLSRPLAGWKQPIAAGQSIRVDVGGAAWALPANAGSRALRYRHPVVINPALKCGRDRQPYEVLMSLDSRLGRFLKHSCLRSAPQATMLLRD